MTKKDELKFEELVKSLKSSLETEQPEEDSVDIQSLLKQIDQAGQVLDLIDGKADSLIAKMDQIISETKPLN
jgi:hypothetical protein